MMGFGVLWMILFWSILLALAGGSAAWLFARIAHERRQSDTHPPTARQILDERLARGEIDREEYETIRARVER